MNARFPRWPVSSNARSGPALDDVIPERSAPRILADRACCCPARPTVLVVMPPSATRRHETDLLLCGHHYRVSRDALTAAGAAISELPVSAGQEKPP